MKKINPIVLLLLVVMLLIGGNYPKALALTEEEIADIERKTWGIFFETDVNDLYPAGTAVVFMPRIEGEPLRFSRSKSVVQ